MGSSEQDAAASAFVSARDGCFWRYGRPYRYAGANMWYAMLLAPGRLVRELDRLKALGVQNLRVLGSMEEVSNVSAQATPAVQSRPGEYDEEVLKGLDRLLYEVQPQAGRAACERGPRNACPTAAADAHPCTTAPASLRVSRTSPAAAQLPAIYPFPALPGWRPRDDRGGAAQQHVAVVGRLRRLRVVGHRRDGATHEGRRIG